MASGNRNNASRSVPVRPLPGSLNERSRWVEALESRLLLNAATKHAASAATSSGTALAANANHSTVKSQPSPEPAAGVASATKSASAPKPSGKAAATGAAHVPAKSPKPSAKSAGGTSAAKPASASTPSGKPFATGGHVPANNPKQPAKPTGGGAPTKPAADGSGVEQPDGSMAVSWTGDGDGVNWTDPKNWSGDAVPTSNDNVTINVAGNPTITLASGSQSINSLSTGDPINFTGGILAVATTIQLSANLTLAGGTIQGGTITQTGSAEVVVNSGTLNGVTADATVSLALSHLSMDFPTLTVLNGLALNSSLLIGSPSAYTTATVNFGQPGAAAGSLTGTGTVLFGPGDNLVNNSDQTGVAGTLTIGPGITIHGNGSIIVNTVGSIVNQGTIDADADTPGEELYLLISPITNTGTLEATDGGNLYVGDALTNLSSGTLAGGNYEVDANSTIDFGTASITTNAANILLSGSGATFNGLNSLTSNSGSLTISSGDNFAPTNAVTNTGTLTVSSGGTLSLGDDWANSGTITANAATLDLGSGTNAWSNFGTITAANSTVNLGGSFTQAGLGAFNEDGDTVNVTGTLTGNLALTAETGSWTLVQGMIVNGTYTASGGSSLVVQYGTFNGVTADATVSLALSRASMDYPTLTVLNGLVLNSNLLIGSPSAYTTATVNFGQPGAAAGSLIGNGTVLFGPGDDILNSSDQTGAAGTLTIGPGITISGNGSIAVNIDGSIVNQGTIDGDANTFGQGLVLLIGPITNTGTLEATGGGDLYVGDALTNLASGTLTGGNYDVYANSTIDFGTASITTNAANILLSGSGGTLNGLNSLTSNSGSLTISSGDSFAPADALTNAGSLIVGLGGNLSPAIALTNTGTLAVSAGGSLTTSALSFIGGNSSLVLLGNISTGTLSIAQSTLDLPGSLFLGQSPGALPAGTLAITGVGAADPAITLAADATSPGTLRLAGGVQVSGGADAVISSSAVEPGQTPGTLDLGGGICAFNINGTAYVPGQDQPDLSISAQLADGGVFKTGSGTLALTNPADAFTGGVNADGGTVVLSNPSSITGGVTASAVGPSSGTISVATDGDLGASSNAINLQGGTLDATGTFATSRSIVLGNSAGVGDGTIAVSSGDTLTLDGSISGAAGLVAAGPGTLDLNTPMAAGQTQIEDGTLLLASGGSLSQSYLTTIGAGATLDLGSQSRTIQALAGAGNVSLGSGTLTIADIGSAYATQFSGAISGSGGVIRSGPGSLTLTGRSSFTGGLTATGGATVYLASASGFKGGITASAGGTVIASSDAAMGDPSNGINLSGGTLQAPASFSTSRAITVSAAGGTINVAAGSSLLASGLLSGAGNLVIRGGGTLRLTAPDSLSGSVAVTAGTLALSAGGMLDAVSAFTLSAGSTLLLDDSTASGGNAAGSRLSTAAPILSGGGQIQLLGTSGTSSSESLGTLTIGPGQTTISITGGAGSGSTASLVFPALLHHAGAQVIFETGDGSTLGGPDQVLLGSYPAGPMSAWVKVQSDGSLGSAAYDPTRGVEPDLA